MDPDKIKKIRIADLRGKYSYQSQNLDIVELAAIYIALPLTFENDDRGDKLRFRADLEEKLKLMYTEYKQKKLKAVLVRNPAYKEVVDPAGLGFEDDGRLTFGERLSLSLSSLLASNSSSDIPVELELSMGATNRSSSSQSNINVNSNINANTTHNPMFATGSTIANSGTDYSGTDKKTGGGSGQQMKAWEQELEAQLRIGGELGTGGAAGTISSSEPSPKRKSDNPTTTPTSTPAVGVGPAILMEALQNNKRFGVKNKSNHESCTII